MRRSILLFLAAAVLLAVYTQFVHAQTSEFTYQGSLNTAGVPANGNFDFEFLLFDAASAGSQIGPILVVNSVAVATGVFSVNLNFGNVFPGANRYLEIRVRSTGQPGWTILTPRQLFRSSPYAIRSLEAANSLALGGVTANQFVVTSDPRLADARPPTPGSANYIQNGTTPQASSNFNISDTGRANIFDATTQYDLGGLRILGNAGANNLFAGVRAGVVNTGSRNTFAGYQAGAVNTSGAANSFFGSNAGLRNTFGFTNSFFGESAGQLNVGGAGNAFFGNSAGASNTEGNGNTFIGSSSGAASTTGTSNTFVGIQSGGNTTGNQNTLIGASAKVASGNLSFATAIGANAIAPTSNSITLGRSGGEDVVRMPGAVILETLSTGGSVSLCRNLFLLVSTCSSSSRYKSNIVSFGSGVDLIQKLRPVSFNWKDGGNRDVGLVAEEVARVEPLLTTTNEKGDVEGVKYDRLTIVLINSIKQQQSRIEEQHRTISRQQAEINQLKRAVCGLKPGGALCPPVLKQ